MKIIVLCFSTLLLSACTHTADLRGFDYGASPFPALTNKRVAVVIEPARIPDNYSTSTDVYTYKFENTVPSITDALQKRLSMSAKEVDVVAAEKLDPKAKYDYYVYPSLNSRSVHDFWTMGCLVKYELEVRAKDNKVLAKEAGEGKRNFFSAKQFDSKCKEALSEVFIKVTDRALNLIQ